jgi:hypothetical protein
MSKANLTRREFARRAALVSAATLMPASKLPTTEDGTHPPPHPAAQSQTEPKLATASQAEAYQRTQAVFSRYGSRLSESQKTEIAKLSAAAQHQLDRVREFPTANADDPALYLKPLMERERKSVLNPPVPKSTAPPAGLTPPVKKP